MEPKEPDQKSPPKRTSQEQPPFLLFRLDRQLARD